jgi:DNA-binding XRE family transcriptional regulator
MNIMSEDLRLKLKAARERLGLTQSKAAKLWGLSLRTLINWENDISTPRGIGLVAINQILDAILSAPPPSPPAKKAARKRAK